MEQSNSDDVLAYEDYAELIYEDREELFIAIPRLVLAAVTEGSAMTNVAVLRERQLAYTVFDPQQVCDCCVRRRLQELCVERKLVIPGVPIPLPYVVRTRLYDGEVVPCEPLGSPPVLAQMPYRHIHLGLADDVDQATALLKKLVGTKKSSKRSGT